MATYRINVKYADGSEFTEEIHSITETVWPKKGLDYDLVDTKRFRAHWLPCQNDEIKITEYKRGFKAWLDSHGLKYTSIVFKRV